MLGLLALLLAPGCSSPGDVSGHGDEGPPFSRAHLNFLVVGDWGRDGRYNQRDVARQMGRVAEEIGARFVLSTGDNFYPSGVSSVKDLQWITSFRAVYTAASLDVPWYVVLGNHDYEGSVEAQIAYTAVSDRWTLPSRYYAVEHAVDDTTEALLVFLDTPLMTRSGGPEALAAELRWLDSTLAASTAEWRLVVGHHPILSGETKGDENPVMIRSVLPILERHGVQAYFSGHAHNLQHLRNEGRVHFFISGAGSQTRAVRPTPDTEFALRGPGFIAASLGPERLRVQFVDVAGRVRYEAAVPRGARAAPEVPAARARVPAAP